MVDGCARTAGHSNCFGEGRLEILCPLVSDAVLTRSVVAVDNGKHSFSVNVACAEP